MIPLILLFLECVALLILGFLSYSALQPIWTKLPKLVRLLLSWIMLLWFVDVFFRATFGALYFRSMVTRQTITFTLLCNSFLSDTGYRGATARYLCKVMSLINPGHCKSLTPSN